MKFAVLDFETTGDAPDRDRIIQVGLVLIDHDVITDRYTSFVQPERSIPALITQLTGITDEEVADAPTIDAVLADMLPLLAGRILVGHNVGFDLKFLQRNLTDNGYFPFQGRVLDTLDFLRVLHPTLTGLSLASVSAQLGVPHDRPHRADSDADATARLWLMCLNKIRELPLVTVQRIAALFAHSVSDTARFWQDMCAEREALATDDELTARPGRVYRQFALAAGEWGQNDDESNDPPAKERLPDSFADFYKDMKERLRKQFGRYEERESQDLMVEAVASAFREGKHLLVEAGTGTGKSLGYLIPALYHGLREERKVVVSTHTINLQEQLRQRDLPLLEALFPVRFRAAVLKGRGRYLCLRKFEQKLILQDFEPDDEDRLIAAQMIVWLGETERGDEEEVQFTPKGRQFWTTVASDTDSCLNKLCPWFKTCFYHRARREAQQADLIITNHSLLFTDVQAEHRILPAYSHLVVDEAHHFEDVASKHLGRSVSYHGLYGTLVRLYKDNCTGLLPLLRHRLESLSDGRGDRWLAPVERLMSQAVDAREQWDRLAGLLFALLADRAADPSQTESGGYVLRLKRDELPDDWDAVRVTADNLQLLLQDIGDRLERTVEEIKEALDDFALQSLLTDLGGAAKDILRQRDDLQLVLAVDDDNYVYWLEGTPNYRIKSLELAAAPVDVSALLRQFVFEPKDSVVLTSATLSVGKTFEYACEQLGLEADGENVRTLQLPSPFQYREQSLVCIPRDFPKIKGSQADPIFLERLVQSLHDVAAATDGRMLVLFTSHRMLRQVHPELKEQLAPHGIAVLGQGVDSGSRSKLTRLFQSQPRSVLLGTSSFWEGLDIPGDALSCLAIVRLPFTPPSHPVAEAKAELLKRHNKNPFLALSVPQAVIRFKQGFGRLIRTSTDRGIVILYDTRVLDSYYGKYFLYSLPGPKIEHMSLDQMVPRITQWLEEMSS